MKTLGRILMILAVFAMVMGITYVVVNAGSSSSPATTPAFAHDREFSRPDGARPEFNGERGGGWMFGMIKNIGILAVIVALIVVPKNIRQKRIKQVSASV